MKVFIYPSPSHNALKAFTDFNKPQHINRIASDAIRSGHHSIGFTWTCSTTDNPNPSGQSEYDTTENDEENRGKMLSEWVFILTVFLVISVT